MDTEFFILNSDCLIADTLCVSLIANTRVTEVNEFMSNMTLFIIVSFYFSSTSDLFYVSFHLCFLIFLTLFSGRSAFLDHLFLCRPSHTQIHFPCCVNP